MTRPYQRRKPRRDLTIALLFALFFVASIGFAVWVHFIAPCSAISWMPAKEIPARCFTFVKDH